VTKNDKARIRLRADMSPYENDKARICLCADMRTYENDKARIHLRADMSPYENDKVTLIESFRGHGSQIGVLCYIMPMPWRKIALKR